MGGPALAFIGLGEAATAIATGLGEAGLEGITAFDRDQDDPARREVISGPHGSERRRPRQFAG